jgi:hypothetical protein
MQTQAQFSYAISKEVIGSRDFRLATLQPEIKARDGVAWARAYAIATQFLEEFKMKTSIATIDREYRGKPVPRDAAFLRKEKPSAYVNQLLLRVEPEPFRAQIAAFVEAPHESPRARSPKVVPAPASRPGASRPGTAASRSQSTPRRGARK